MITGMPISISLGLTVLTFLFAFTQVPIESVALKLFTGIEKFEIMAIPFFILAGNFLTHGGVAKRMIRFATSLVGHWPGGLGLGAVVACALFAAISGSSPATVVAVGSILIPAMVKAGYPMRFGAGVVASAGGAGHPDPAVDRDGDVRGVDQQLDRRAVHGRRDAGPRAGRRCWGSPPGTAPGSTSYPKERRATWGERWTAFRESIWGLALIVVVMGGIYSGIFTPTEAAAMSAVYAFVVAVFVYKDLKLKDVPKMLLASANMSAMLLYIITNAILFSFLLTHENMPQAISEWLLGNGLGMIGFLLAVNLLLLVMGNFMEPSSIILITAPILFPIAMKLGIDPIHFGVMITVNMEIGMITPPVGLNLYVASGISKLGLSEMTVAVWPWLLTMLVFLVLVTYWPPLTIWLPRTLGMM